MPATMTLLADLPNELLILVFRQFYHVSRDPERPLAALCRTSRRFRILAEPLLYYSWSNRFIVTKRYCSPYAIFARPALIGHVRALDLFVPNPSDRAHRLPHDAFIKLTHATDKIGYHPSFRGAFMDFLAANCYSRATQFATLVFVLVHRRLESLTLRVTARNKNVDDLITGVIRRTLMSNSKELGSLSNLRTFTIVNSPGRPSTRLLSLAYVFKLPNLRQFEIRGCLEHDLGYLSPGSSRHMKPEMGEWELINDASVQTLIFRESDIWLHSLEVLLARCKALKHVHLEVADPSDETNSTPYSESHALDQHLCRHSESLEGLSIVFLGVKDENFPDWGSLSLSRFSKLNTVRVPRNYLLNEDVSAMTGAEMAHYEARLRPLLPPLPEVLLVRDQYVHFGHTRSLP